MFCGREFVQDAALKNGCTASPLKELMDSHEHLWIHWRLSSEHSDNASNNVVALGLQCTDAGTEGAKPYDGKNWFPFTAQAMSTLQSPGSS